MKSKLSFFALVTILVLALSGCSEEAPAPPPTTGGLIIKVALQGSTGFLTGVPVGLATSQANLDRGIYLQDKRTDSSGKVDFGQLNPGNYYYDAEYTTSNASYYGEGQVQIVAGRNQELTLLVRP